MISEAALRLIGAMMKSSLYLDRCPVVVEIAGFRHGSIPSLEELEKALYALIGEKIRFIREPENTFDSHAIRMELPDGRKIGYVPKEKNAPFAERMDRGEEVYGIAAGGIAVAVITEDIVFRKRPPLVVVKPTKITVLSEEERNAVRELTAWLPYLRKMKGKDTDEILDDGRFRDFNRTVYSPHLIDCNYLENIERLNSYSGSLQEMIPYANYTETKAYLTFIVRTDRFCYGGGIENNIASGEFIPVIERLKLFADGE